MVTIELMCPSFDGMRPVKSCLRPVGELKRDFFERNARHFRSPGLTRTYRHCERQRSGRNRLAAANGRRGTEHRLPNPNERKPAIAAEATGWLWKSPDHK
jgi:hypothetical protein